MLTQFALASAEATINRVLSLDSTVSARLAPLSGQVIAIVCTAPALTLHLIPLQSGLQLLKLVSSADKSAVLHHPEVDLEGNSGLLMELAQILQDLELDWEYEVSRWLGPLPTALLSGRWRSSKDWLAQSAQSLHVNTADYLAEESRALVGHAEANTRFDEIDQLQLDLDRLDARVARLLKRKQKPL